MGRVGGGQCNCVRVWIHFPTEEAVFGITVPRDLEALLKATRDVPGLNCRCYLPNISFFFFPSRQPLEPLDERCPRRHLSLEDCRSLLLFEKLKLIFICICVCRAIGEKSDRGYVRSTWTLFAVRR